MPTGVITKIVSRLYNPVVDVWHAPTNCCQPYLHHDGRVPLECLLFFVKMFTFPGIHFTNGLWAYKPNLLKFCMALTQKLIIRSDHNFAHVTTAEQNCDLIGSLQWWLKWKENSQYNNYEVINCVWNDPQEAYEYLYWRKGGKGIGNCFTSHFWASKSNLTSVG